MAEQAYVTSCMQDMTYISCPLSTIWMYMIGKLNMIINYVHYDYNSRLLL
jgi:hypothetical protein